MSPLRCFTLVLIALCAAGVSLKAEPPVVKPDDAPPRTDHFGDPLPEGAVARLGTLRFRHSAGNIRCWAILPDGKTVATGCQEEEAVCFLDVNNGKELRRIEGITLASLLSYSRSGKFLAVGTNWGPKNVCLFDAMTCKEIQHFEIRGRGLWGVAFAEGEKELVTVCENGSTTWWDTTTGKLLREWNCLARSTPKEERPVLRQPRFSADGRVMTAHTRRLRPIGEKPDTPDEPKKPIEDGVTVWDLENRKELTFVRDASGQAFDLSPDGKYLVWSKIGEGFFLTDTKTGRELYRLDCNDKDAGSVDSGLTNVQ
jgi:WD40 repeat protein